MNYYDSFYGASKTTSIAMDKKPADSGSRIYVVECNDRDGNLLKLLQTIKHTGNCGHSFSIVIDPDSKDKKTVGWDGDGSDKIGAITSTQADLDLRKVLLANINTIKYICDGALPSKYNDEPDDPIEALKKISVTCDTLLDGNSLDFGNGIKNVLNQLIDNAKRYIKDCDTPPNENWTPKEDFEHLLWCLKHYYEQMVESQQKDGEDGPTEVKAMDEMPLKVGDTVKIRKGIRCLEAGKTGVVDGFVKSHPPMVIIRFDDGHRITVVPDGFIEGFNGKN